MISTILNILEIVFWIAGIVGTIGWIVLVFNGFKNREIFTPLSSLIIGIVVGGITWKILNSVLFTLMFASGAGIGIATNEDAKPAKEKGPGLIGTIVDNIVEDSIKQEQIAKGVEKGLERYHDKHG